MNNIFDRIDYHHLVLESEQNEELLNQMAMESEFLLNSYETNIILEADETVDDKQKTEEKRESFFEKMKEFITRIWNMFLSKMNELFKIDERWLEKTGTEKNFNKIVYDENISFNLYPYHDIKDTKIIDILKQIKSLIDPNKMTSTEDVSVDGILKANSFLNEYGSTMDEFKKNILLYFKIGSTDQSKMKVTLYKAEAVKKQCVGVLLPYVHDYRTKTTSDLKTLKGSVDNAIKNIERMIKNSQTKESVGESFCLIENALYKDTDLRYCMNSHILFEDTNNTDDKKENLNGSVSDSKNDKYDGNDMVKRFENKSSKELEYAKNIMKIFQVAIASAFTAVEEKYRQSMKVLRGVMKARGPKESKEIKEENKQEKKEQKEEQRRQKEMNKK